MINKKIKKLVIPLVILTSLNLLIVVKAFADQTVNLSISQGFLFLPAIEPLNFNRTVLVPNAPKEISLALNPANPDPVGKITVVDQEVGDPFTLDVTLQNLVDNSGAASPNILRYDNFKILTFTQNQTESVDNSSYNNPPGSNNITAPLDYKPPSSNYIDVVNNPDQVDSANFTVFPLDLSDPDPNDAGSESRPVTIMQRLIPGVFPNIGTYSTGMVLRATLPPGTPGGNYHGQLTVTLTH